MKLFLTHNKIICSSDLGYKFFCKSLRIMRQTH